MIQPDQSPIGARQGRHVPGEMKKRVGDHRGVVERQRIGEGRPHQGGDRPALLGDQHVALRLAAAEFRLDLFDGDLGSDLLALHGAVGLRPQRSQHLVERATGDELEGGADQPGDHRASVRLRAQMVTSATTAI